MIQVPPRRLLLLAAGFILWAGAFLTLYGVNAVGCAFAWPRPLQRGILLTLLALHIAALGYLAWYCWQQRRAHDRMRFVEYVGFGATISALAATLLTFAPSLVLTLCD
ncbi:hypothetical protein [Steroidobacter cummioxidans]|uniref:hypothetical protein n=1 Tax=Steroidobacter cummioxidans TaxID=1803913 RepID=UPI000E30F6CE|nr:hypothetical protein [Steroidobacter cummioxidans]